MDKIIIIFVVIVVLAAAAFIIAAIRQPKKIKEWLLYAVTEAEKELGGGTGQIKLRKVYDQFMDKYPTVSFWVAFETFEKWVDIALEEMKKLLNENKKIKTYVQQ